jgi:hypothetical protein
MPTADGGRDATFHVLPWDDQLRDQLREAGLPPMPFFEQDAAATAEERRQLWLSHSIMAAVGILDPDKAWEGLYKVDGTELPYEPPDEATAGTAADPRCVLALEYVSLFGGLKTFSFNLVHALLAEREGNSGSSFDSTMAGEHSNGQNSDSDISETTAKPETSLPS